jgi:kynurenine formamidase
MTRLIDISIPIFGGLKQISSYDQKIKFPYEEVEISKILTPDMEGSNNRTTRQMKGILHTGSHIDGPEHLIPGAKQIHEFPLETFYGEAVIADVRKPSGKAITASEIDENVGHLVKEGDILIIRTGRTGWSKRISTEGYMTGTPYLDESVANWCVKMKIKLVGSDCRPNKPGDTNFTFEKTLLQNDILYLKNLDNLDAVRKKRVKIVAFPLKFVGTEAAMTRAVVIEED